MTYDPAWDMPKVNWQQQGSFEQGELALVDHPSDAPLVCIPPINRNWLPYILGCLDQLTNPSTWITSSDAALNAILDKAIELKQIVGQAGDCVLCPEMRLQDCVLQFSCDSGATWTDVSGWVDNFPPCVQSAAIITTPPPNPGGRTTDQMACSIAGYLTDQIITVAIQQAVDNINNNRNLLQLGVDLALVIPEFVLVGLFVNAVADFYTFFSSMTVSDFEAALTDPALFSDIRCAIYNAIAADGHLTTSNFPTVLTNISAISYVHSNVITSIHDFLQTMGFPYLNQLSQGAGLNPYDDCSDCGMSPSWCYNFDFRTGMHGWSVPGGNPGTWTASIGFEGTLVGSNDELVMVLAFGTELLTDVEVEQVTSQNANGGLRKFFTQTGGSATESWNLNGGASASPILTTHTPTLSCDNVVLVLNTNGFGAVTNVIQSVKFKGTGINPFGPNNC
jgi:hypothetical protein